MLGLIFDPVLIGKPAGPEAAPKDAAKETDKKDKFDGLTPLQYWRKLQWTKKEMHGIEAKDPLCEDIFQYTDPM